VPCCIVRLTEPRISVDKQPIAYEDLSRFGVNPWVGGKPSTEVSFSGAVDWVLAGVEPGQLESLFPLTNRCASLLFSFYCLKKSVLDRDDSAPSSVRSSPCSSVVWSFRLF
jgi:hypothetical protein